MPMSEPSNLPVPYAAPAPPVAPSVAPGWYPHPQSGQNRWWDGNQWTENFAPVTQAPGGATNGVATAALVLGILGFLITGIPLGIGLLLGGPLDLLAIILGIVGAVRASKNSGLGNGAAIWGIVLGSIATVSIFFGAGTIW